MQLHELRPKHGLKAKKRIGRGGKRGTYSGKGFKGQKSRSGHRFAPVIRELIKKHHKLRGYRNKSKLKNQKPKIIINLGKLENKFKAGEIVNPVSLIKRGLAFRIKGKIPEVKILARGEIRKRLIIKGCELSESAKKEIDKAGGKIESSIKK